MIQLLVSGLERILALCREAGLPQCSRLEQLLESAGRLPEDLFLQAHAGVLEELEEEAAKRSPDELAALAREARRDTEWALGGSGW